MYAQSQIEVPFSRAEGAGKNPNKEDYTEKAEELRGCLLEWLKKKNSEQKFKKEKNQ